MTPQTLHNLALRLDDAADFIRSHTEPGIKILNHDGYVSELKICADIAVTTAKAIQRGLLTYTGGAQ